MPVISTAGPQSTAVGHRDAQRSGDEVDVTESNARQADGVELDEGDELDDRLYYGLGHDSSPELSDERERCGNELVE
jgi:hypothetical protein